MSYKTILVHLDKKSIAEHRVRIAANLAIAEDACLIGVAMIGISTMTFQQAHIGSGSRFSSEIPPRQGGPFCPGIRDGGQENGCAFL